MIITDTHTLNAKPGDDGTAAQVAAIFIGTDRLLFSRDSAVRKRVVGYAEKYAHLYDFVFSLKKHHVPAIDQLSPRCTAYSTNTYTRLGYMLRAFLLAMRTVNKVADDNTITSLYISTQDPFETGVVGALLRLYAKMVCGIPVVWNVDIHTDLYSPYFSKGSFLNKARLLISTLILPHADAIRVVSNRIKQSLLDRSVDTHKITVRPIAVDNQLKSTDSIYDTNNVKSTGVSMPPQEISDTRAVYWPIVFMAGRLMPEKDYFLALKIFARYVNELKKWPDGMHVRPILCIAGEGQLRSALEKKAKDLMGGTEYSIRFFGGVAADTMVHWYKAAHIFLHTSRFEGYGMVLREAYDAGLPIVTTDVGIAPDLAIENPGQVSVFQVGDESAGVECLLQVTRHLQIKDKKENK